MKIGAIPENLIEKGGLALGQAPIPTIETQGSLMLAQSLITATRLGVFEALATESLAPQAVATRCNVNVEALKKLLNALAQSGYLQQKDDCYKLAPVARKWLLKNNEVSISEFVASRVLTWTWLTRLEDFIRTGEGINIHQEMSPAQWRMYMRGMRSLASIAAADVAACTPIPPNARLMLDVGGSHGYFSATLCRKYPDLRSVILELPEAVEHSAPILAEEGMGDRVVHKVGNALTDDLGVSVYDIIFLSNLVHHFDEATNITLFERLSQALRPGGYLIVQKMMVPDKEEGQVGSFIDLFFSLTSAAGNWSFSEIAGWQQKVGLEPWKTIHFPILRTPGDCGQQVAKKL